MQRRLIEVGVFGLLGAATATVVAWAVAMSLPMAVRSAQSARALEGDRPWGLSVWSGEGWTVVHGGSPVAEAWSPWQVIGPPDTPGSGDISTAWASQTQDGQVEWLRLRYAEPVAAVAVVVHETYNPGALRSISTGRGDDRAILWRGVDPTTPGSARGVSRVEIDHEHPLDEITITLDSPAVPGWNEIDAVGLVDRSGTVHWAIDVTASSTYASVPPRPWPAPREIAPSWCTRLIPELRGDAPGAVGAEDRVLVATGWPLRAFRRAVDGPRAVSSRMPAPWRLMPASNALGATVPLSPIWPGLLGDAVIFAAAWVLLVAVLRRLMRARVARVVREAWRARQGRCAACGFDLRFDLAAGCPECGWRRESSDRSTGSV